MKRSTCCGMGVLEHQSPVAALGAGSHLFPDLTKPVTKSKGCDRIKARLKLLSPRAVSA